MIELLFAALLALLHAIPAIVAALIWFANVGLPLLLLAILVALVAAPFVLGMGLLLWALWWVLVLGTPLALVFGIYALLAHMTGAPFAVAAAMGLLAGAVFTIWYWRELGGAAIYMGVVIAALPLLFPLLWRPGATPTEAVAAADEPESESELDIQTKRIETSNALQDDLAPEEPAPRRGAAQEEVRPARTPDVSQQEGEARQTAFEWLRDQERAKAAIREKLRREEEARRSAEEERRREARERAARIELARAASGWSRLEKGMTREEVRRLLGGPKWRDTGLAVETWMFAERTTLGCATVTFLDGAVAAYRAPWACE